MLKSQEVVGLTVVDAKTEKRVGQVCDLIFDDTPRLEALLLEEDGWLRRKRFAPLEAIVIGTDLVLLKDNEQLQPYDEKDHTRISVCTGERCLKGRSLKRLDGSELGRVENVYFAKEMGTIIGYELTDGLISDLMDGRRFFRTSQPLYWGKDVLIVGNDSSKLDLA